VLDYTGVILRSLLPGARKIAADVHASFTDLTRVFAGMFYDTVHFDGEDPAVRDVLSAEFEHIGRVEDRRVSILTMLFASSRRRRQDVKAITLVKSNSGVGIFPSGGVFRDEVETCFHL
jgi:hypothetical protein